MVIRVCSRFLMILMIGLSLSLHAVPVITSKRPLSKDAVLSLERSMRSFKKRFISYGKCLRGKCSDAEKEILKKHIISDGIALIAGLGFVAAASYGAVRYFRQGTKTVGQKPIKNDDSIIVSNPNNSDSADSAEEAVPAGYTAEQWRKEKTLNEEKIKAHSQAYQKIQEAVRPNFKLGKVAIIGIAKNSELDFLVDSDNSSAGKLNDITSAVASSLNNLYKSDLYAKLKPIIGQNLTVRLSFKQGGSERYIFDLSQASAGWNSAAKTVQSVYDVDL